MNQIKRIILITALLLVIVPLNAFAETISTAKPHDYNNGLLDIPELIKDSNMPLEAFDNDLSTRVGLPMYYSEKFFVEFTQPVNLQGIYLNFTSNYSSTKAVVQFYDGTEQLISDFSNNTIDEYVELDFKGVSQIQFYRSSSNGGAYLYEFEAFGEYDTDYVVPGTPGDTTPPGEVEDVAVVSSENSAAITYTEPGDIDFSHVNIYVEGELYEGENGRVVLDNLPPNTLYEAVIKTVDTLGNESKGVVKEFKTDYKPPETAEELPEVKNLNVEATDERADLSWENPPRFFEKAKIYRKNLGSNATAFNLNPFAPMTVHAAEEYKPLFETNGTEFSDLSIEPETEYEYKVTSVYEGMETNGVTVRTAIPKAPLIDTDEVKLPFGVGELIKSGNGLIALIGGFILLALSFVLVPKLIALIRTSNGGQKSVAVAGGGKDIKVGRERQIKAPREGKAPRMARESPKVVRESTRMPREPRIGRR